ncbi:hypothetical protein HOL21_02600 [Candidatus Woesearchaeota archaeon]|jgi:hypothetical protein|nr:hypothetical protein [Candidatus Woesearchaeota archaeon]MBT5397080.1 hypothetical protein [Candidatus Woesearchaeota archaeon]MBT6367374.1 hypothetical protein [Candidatus Woesearchaeota archaeon]MBT7762480.1 hypothetical protein [Candidatus Woesearchaeota archaeon]
MGKRHILGLTEAITISNKDGDSKSYTARIDTGATASSIDQTIASELKLGPITRIKIIKSASGIGKRPIVVATVKIGDLTVEEEFTLADRSHMTYPLLIGQNILKIGKFLIDPLKK